jgi:hypothetical protein
VTDQGHGETDQGHGVTDQGHSCYRKVPHLAISFIY